MKCFHTTNCQLTKTRHGVSSSEIDFSVKFYENISRFLYLLYRHYLNWRIKLPGHLSKSKSFGWGLVQTGHFVGPVCLSQKSSLVSVKFVTTSAKKQNKKRTNKKTEQNKTKQNKNTKKQKKLKKKKECSGKSI